MFCPKCGEQLAENTVVCQKCGSKVLQNDSHDDFKAYVDSHVRKNTKFQSAEELLKSKVPVPFAKFCYGIPVVLALLLLIFGDTTGVNPFEVLLLLGFAFLVGNLPASIGANIAKSRHVSRNMEKAEGEIDVDDLIRFLSSYLNYLHPYFREWGYLQRHGTNIRGKVEVAITESLAKTFKEVGIYTEFGEKRRRLAVIYVRPAVSAPDSGQMEYLFSGQNKVEGSVFVSHDAVGFQQYKCQIKITPILQAAVKYYLEIYRNKPSDL